MGFCCVYRVVYLLRVDFMSRATKTYILTFHIIIAVSNMETELANYNTLPSFDSMEIMVCIMCRPSYLYFVYL